MAVRFDAAADRLTHNGSYPQTNLGWTYTAWVRIQVDQNDWATYLRLSAGGGTIATNGVNSSGTQGPGYYTALASVEIASDISSPTTNVWVPVAGVRDSVTGKSRTYRKTSGVGSTVVSADSTLTTSDLASIPDQICIGGRGSGDAAGWWSGDIAYVRVWSVTLTQTEIEAEWASLTPVKTTGLHSNWRLDDPLSLVDTVASKTLAVQSGGLLGAAIGPLVGTENRFQNPCAGVDSTGYGGSASPVRTTGLLAKGLPIDTGVKYTAGVGFVRTCRAAVTAGNTYTFSIYGKANGTALATTYIGFINASDVEFDYNNFGPFGTGITGVARKTGTFIALTGTTEVCLIIDGGVDCELTGLLLEEGSVAHDYADGDTPGWQWNGTTGKSSSQVSGGGPSPISGAVAGSLPTPGGALAGTVRTSGAFAGALPAPGGSLAGNLLLSGLVAGALPTPGGSLAGVVFAPGAVAGALPSPGGAVAGVVFTPGAVAGALPAPGGSLTGSLRTSGQLSGEFPAPSGALAGLIRVLGAVAGSLPHLGGALDDVLVLLTQDEYALDVHRENTRAFIRADPYSVTLRTRTSARTATGGVIRSDASFRQPQIGKLIMVSPAGGSIEQRTDDGTERQIDYILLLEWDAEVEIGDWWDDQRGNRWEVKALVPTNNYETRAVVEAHGKVLTGG